MRIILCAFDESLQKAWDAALAEVAGPALRAGHTLETTLGDITRLNVTAVVSPANSYGYMRGGVDLAYARRFGPGLENNLRARIVALPQAMLPVGQALAVATGDTAIPWLISAPTMEQPMRLPGPEPVQAASRAAAAFALQQGYASVAFPGMGTGTGGLAPDAAAFAMLRGLCQGLDCSPG